MDVKKKKKTYELCSLWNSLMNTSDVHHYGLILRSTTNDIITARFSHSVQTIVFSQPPPDPGIWMMYLRWV